MSCHRKSSIHWLALTTIVFALVVGFLFALGHHVFYVSLDRETVSTESFHLAGTRLPKQEFNSAVGIAFALLVRTFFTIAISTAYVQIFWRNIRTTKKSPTLTELDWASSCMNNILKICNVKFWRKHFTLVALAIIFWCVPVCPERSRSLSLSTGQVSTHRHHLPTCGYFHCYCAQSVKLFAPCSPI